jgi:hypothetical protein
VHGPEAARPIEDVQVGDRVFAYDLVAERITERAVLRTFVHHVEALIELRLESTIVRCTAEHPFWVPHAGWRTAGTLEVGMPLLALDGRVLAIAGIDRLRGPVTVYNIEVADEHDYFVSDVGLLVHNKGGIIDPRAEAQRIKEQAQALIDQRPAFKKQFQELEKKVDAAVKANDPQQILDVNAELRAFEDTLDQQLKTDLEAIDKEIEAGVSGKRKKELREQRKTIKKKLGSSAGVEEDLPEEVLEAVGIDPKNPPTPEARAQQLHDEIVRSLSKTGRSGGAVGAQLDKKVGAQLVRDGNLIQDPATAEAYKAAGRRLMNQGKGGVHR